MPQPTDETANGQLAEGELVDLIDEFSDGRIQFAFVKVKDPNTTLPKCVLIAWVCIILHWLSTCFADNPVTAVRRRCPRTN